MSLNKLSVNMVFSENNHDSSPKSCLMIVSRYVKVCRGMSRYDIEVCQEKIMFYCQHFFNGPTESEVRLYY